MNFHECMKLFYPETKIILYNRKNEVVLEGQVNDIRKECEKYHNIEVVYTKEAETADQYIERTTHQLGAKPQKYRVTVATSDGLEQIIIMGQGAHRISARGLQKEIEDTEKAARQEWHQRRQSSKNYLFDNMSEELQAEMEKIRLGEKGTGDESI